MNICLYARVSTRKKNSPVDESLEPAWKQDPEVQLAPLRRMARDRGLEVIEEYVDRETGSKESREALMRLMADAKRGHFKMVVCWKFDRFARTVRQLAMALEEFRSLQIDFVSHTEAIDTSTPMGRAMFGMVAVFAELERENTRERVRAGMDRAKEKGTKSGKQIGRPRLVFRRDEVIELRDDGKSWPQIAAKLGVSEATLRRAVVVERLNRILNEHK
jgi:DNA invertase Pin-like site-specific DNA recombinase